LAEVPEAGWREVGTYRGHRWAEPDAAQFAATLRRIAEEPEEARKRGGRAREEVLEQFDRRAVARQIQAELARVTREKEKRQAREQVKEQEKAQSRIASDEAPPVRWEGAFFSWHSLGQVNRELCLALLEEHPSESGLLDARGHPLGAAAVSELSLLPVEPMHFGPEADPRFGELARRCFAPLSRPAQVHVRHFFPPRFERPSEGRFVLIQPWEYGYLPEQWIEPVQKQVDEVWCYSKYVRRVYLDSGIDAAKLHVVPLGVDPKVFHPGVPPCVFTDEPGAAALRGRSGRKTGKALSGKGERETFVFLYVGGSLHRKGIDILLEAYRRAFTRLDDVCLVVKDTGTSTVYRIGNEKERILRLIAENQGPPIVYTDADLSSHQLAGLYAACDCLVQPYRGEGFCLPALEAMACGLPVVVPEGGPTDDFVDESVGWRVPAEHKPFDVGPHGRGRVGHFECVGPTWMFEVEVDDLARRLRRIAGEPEEARRRGTAAAERAHAKWTWRHSAERAAERMRALAEWAGVAPAPAANDAEGGGMASGPENTPSGSKLWLPPGVAATSEVHNGTAQGNTEGSTAQGIAEAVAVLAGEAPPARPEPAISLVMIVKNEERVLGDCLRTARPWFDEMIVVDTGSTDRTIEIAEEYGAKVFHFPWCDDFSAARNVSLEHATGDWVFWMDADDTLLEECGRQLRELARLAEDRVTGFIAQVHIPAAPGETGFTIVDHVKLFRNRPEHRFIGRIHEQILEPIQKAGGTVERSGVYVVHSGYDHSPEGQVKKRQRDLTILEKDLADRPDHPFVLFNIGMTAYHMKEYAQAEAALGRCLELSRPHESTVRKVYAMLAGCRLAQDDAAGARRWAEAGLALYPRDPELLFRAGIIHRELGDLEKAEQSYLLLLTARETGHVDSLDVTMTGFKAHHNLALIYRDMGRLDRAEVHFREAIAHDGQFAPSWAGLAETLRHLSSVF
jgi:glycosyltransferase involved in cell wall biosynthesis